MKMEILAVQQLYHPADFNSLGSNKIKGKFQTIEKNKLKNKYMKF